MKESGATMVLFMTWARKKEPENQSLLTDNYTKIAKELGACVVPVGTAWQKVLAKHDHPVMAVIRPFWAEDKSTALVN